MHHNEELEEIGRLLAAARAYARLSVTEMAARFGCSRNSITAYEAGRLPADQRRRDDIVRRYVDVTGVDPEALGLRAAA